MKEFIINNWIPLLTIVIPLMIGLYFGSKYDIEIKKKK